MTPNGIKYHLFAALLRKLTDDRYPMGVDVYLQLQKLLNTLPEEVDAETLRDTLCPLLAKSETQQVRFYELFHEAHLEVRALLENRDIPPPPPPPVKPWGWMAGIILTLLMLLGLAGWFFYQSQQLEAVAEATPIPRPFLAVIGDTTNTGLRDTTRILLERPIQEFGWIQAGDTTQKSGVSAYGRFSLPAPGQLQYIANEVERPDNDRLTDTIQVQLLGAAGRRQTIVYVAELTSPLIGPGEEEDSIDPNTYQPLFTKIKEYPAPFDLNDITIQPRTDREAWIAENIGWLRWALMALTALLLWFILQLREYYRRRLIADLESSDQPPYFWNIDLAQDTKIEVPLAYDQLINKMRQRTSGDVFQIDVPQTIDATIAKGGMVDFKFRQSTRPPEYLLLIDRDNRSNHRARLFDWLYQRFRENEIFAERFFFDGDINLCFNEAYPEGLHLNELQYKFPNARLIVVGLGYNLLHNLTGRLASWTNIFQQWSSRAILTPQARSKWGRRERLLAEQFTLLPASMEGFNLLLDTLEEESEENEMPAWRDLVQDDPKSAIRIREDQVLTSLQQHFSPPVVRWLAACAIYPSLHWDLTLFIGRLLETEDQPLLNFATLNRISQISWLVEGKIPRPARAQLVEFLERQHPEVLTQVRQSLHDLFQNQNLQPPKESAAWEEFNLNMAFNEWSFTSDKARKKELEKEIQQALAKGVETDFTVVKYLEGEKGPLDFILPNAWKRKIKYDGGQVSLVKRYWKDLVYGALPVWIAVTILLWCYQPQVTGCEANAIRTLDYQDNTYTVCTETPVAKLIYHEFLFRTGVEANWPVAIMDSVMTALQGPDTTDWEKITGMSLPADNARYLDSLLQATAKVYEDNRPAKGDSLLEQTYFHYLQNRAVTFYNWGVANANTADSLFLENILDAEIWRLKDRACWYFERAAAFNDQLPASLQLSAISRTGNFCAVNQVRIQLDERRSGTFALTLRDTLRNGGFLVEDYTLGNVRAGNTVRYFTPDDTVIANQLMTFLQDRFAFDALRSEMAARSSDDLEKVLEVAIDDDDRLVNFGGYVLTETGDPLGGVQIKGPENMTIQTDNSGYYTFELSEPLPRQLTLTYTKAGWDTTAVTMPLQENVSLPPVSMDEVAPLVAISLTGRVQDANTQEGLPGVTIQPTLEGMDAGQSGPNGQFTYILNVPDDIALPITFTFSQGGYQPERFELTTLEGASGLIIALAPDESPSIPVDTPAVTTPPIDSAATAWQAIANTQDIRTILDFLTQYPEASTKPQALERMEALALATLARDMVTVAGGTFDMGCTKEQGNDCSSDEEPVHAVTLSSYGISRYEVTNSLFAAFLNSYGSDTLKAGPNAGEKLIYEYEWGVQLNKGIWMPAEGYAQHPVVYVTWYGANTFAAWANAKSGIDYHLPTEAQWEFAARGGNQTRGYKFSGSDDLGDVAWSDENSYDLGSDHPDYGTHPVGLKNANELGLRDMSGNVWEWCSDWYGSYTRGNQVDPRGPEDGSSRVLRGGSWDFNTSDCRVSDRDRDDPGFRNYFIGFRLAQD